jgi:hypothetical protein
LLLCRLQPSLNLICNFITNNIDTVKKYPTKLIIVVYIRKMIVAICDMVKLVNAKRIDAK